MKAPFQLPDLCFFVVVDKHDVDVKDWVDLGLVGQMPDIHTWVGNWPIVA